MRSRTAPKRFETLLVSAMVLFTIGMVAIIAIFCTPLLTGNRPGLALYLIAMATPLGFALGIAHALRSGRRAR
jgi:hypothetical protein